MFFAKRTRQRLLVAAVASSLYLVMVGAVVALRPVDGKEFWQSFGLLALGIPVALTLALASEAFGTWALRLPFWDRIPRWARIGLLVVIICLIVTGVLGVTHRIS